MPKVDIVRHNPKPADPVQQARDQIALQRTLPPFAQLVRQQMAAHEAEILRLDAVIADVQAQIETHARTRDHERKRCQHLAAWLAGTDQKE